MYLFNKIWLKMGSNYNRFVPTQWLRAAQSQQGYYGNSFGGYGWWQPVSYNNFCYPQDERDRVTGVYNNLQRQYQTTGVEFRKSPNSRNTSKTCGTRVNRGKNDYLSLENDNTRSMSKNPFSKKDRSPDPPRFDESKAKRYFSQTSTHRHSSRSDRYDEPFQNQGKYKKGKFDGPSTSSAVDESDTSSEGVLTDSSIKDDDIERFRLVREWEMIDPPPNVDRQTTSKKHIRVMSYNILSQKLLNLNRSLYRKCHPEILRWNYRWKKLKLEIEEFDADILCFQEVEEYHYCREIFNFLETMGYECQYKKRTGNNPNKPDGVVIAYKRSKFQLDSMKKVEYYRGNFSPVNQDNVGLITLLKPIQEDSTPMDECICVVNTHLLYNPKRGDTKLVQLATLLAEVHKATSHCNSASQIPIILCGDFNSTADSHLFNFISTQKLCYNGVHAKSLSGQNTKGKGANVFPPYPLLPECLNISEKSCTFIKDNSERNNKQKENPPKYEISHSTGAFISAHSHDKPEASTTQDHGITVDYIFHTPAKGAGVSATEQRSLNLYPCKRLGLIHPDDLRRVNGLPNPVHPSDHLPIVVDFVLSY